MHTFLEEYGSLMMGSVAILGLFISGLISSNRDRARKARESASAESVSGKNRYIAPIRR